MIRKQENILFTAALCVLSGLAVYESASLWADHEGVDGPAFVPLTVSVLLLILSVFEMVYILKKKPDKGTVTNDEQQTDAHRQAVIRISVCCSMIVLFCTLICAGVSFWISSPVFLFALMTFLRKGNIVGNLLITCMFTGFVYLVFVIGFGVYLP